MIVRISLKFRQRFRCFNSSLTKFQRSFGRNFNDFFCGKMLWQNVLPQYFWSKKIVEISSKVSLLQLKFDEIWTNVLTKFWPNFFVAKRCGIQISSNLSWSNEIFDEISTIFLIKNLVAKRFATTFCHKKKSLKFRQRFRCFNSSSDEILTKFWRKNLWQNLVAKRFATKHPTKSLTKFWRNENERNNKENPYTRTYCKWEEIMVEFDHKLWKNQNVPNHQPAMIFLVLWNILCH